jgi:nucleoside-diphosphate-sugar epimerase
MDTALQRHPKLRSVDDVYRDVNATGTQRLIDAAAATGMTRFIHCSTNGVHGGIKNPPGNEDSPVKPGDVHQKSKWEGEQISMRAFASGRIRVAVLRPAAAD